ncbi:putative tubulin tyrosine ligase-related [Paratrimastix pyriformis]|uniref:Tubulin tyrosine ligase-related n=1 Tax=Paratrimastix pyriformis TaxID=342808 RepID=A0ABQ8UQ86_9EUKA|nr:putative tubulin tyrosine ligase-related [Paratrimastix pyriformis]
MAGRCGWRVGVQLRKVPGLLERVRLLTGLDQEEAADDDAQAEDEGLEAQAAEEQPEGEEGAEGEEGEGAEGESAPPTLEELDHLVAGQNHPGLRGLLGRDGPGSQALLRGGGPFVRQINLDGRHLATLAPLRLERFGATLVSLSLRENQLADFDELRGLLGQLPALRALWLNDNPHVTALVSAAGGAEAFYQQHLAEVAPRLEMLNRMLLSTYTEWALLFMAQLDLKTQREDMLGAEGAFLSDLYPAGCPDDAAPRCPLPAEGPDQGGLPGRLEEIITLDLSGRGVAHLKEALFARMVRLRALDLSDNPSGLLFCPLDPSAISVTATRPAAEDELVLLPNPNTARVLGALTRVGSLTALRYSQPAPEDDEAGRRVGLDEAQLVALLAQWLPGLQLINGVAPNSKVETDPVHARQVAEAYGAFWRFAQSYRLKNAAAGAAQGAEGPEEAEPADGEEWWWFLPDPVGCRIAHTEGPANVRMAPFFDVQKKTAYSVVWPIATIEPGQCWARDYFPGVTDPELRRVLLAGIKGLPMPPRMPSHLSLPPVCPAATTTTRAWACLMLLAHLAGAVPVPDRPHRPRWPMAAGRAGAAAAAPQAADAQARAAAGRQAGPCAAAATAAQATCASTTAGPLRGPAVMRVYTDHELIRQYLKSPRFAFTEDPEDADVVWLRSDTTDDLFAAHPTLRDRYQGRGRPLWVSHFEGEGAFTQKHNLAATCAACSGGWCPPAMNLDPMHPGCLAETARFVEEWRRLLLLVRRPPPQSRFLQPPCPLFLSGPYSGRVWCGAAPVGQAGPERWQGPFADPAQGLGRLWLAKPWQATRALGIVATAGWLEALRLCRENPAPPRVVSRYLEQPVLLPRLAPGYTESGPREGLPVLKFDLRFIVCLHALHPRPRVSVYRQFWSRLANNPFACTDLDQYETHFTVMNYDPAESHRPTPRQWQQLHDHQFVALFDHIQRQQAEVLEGQPSTPAASTATATCTAASAASAGSAPIDLDITGNSWQAVRQKPMPTTLRHAAAHPMRCPAQIHAMFLAIFEAAAARIPAGPSSALSRGMYGIDVMLARSVVPQPAGPGAPACRVSIDPVLLEVNFGSHSRPACLEPPARAAPSSHRDVFAGAGWSGGLVGGRMLVARPGPDCQRACRQSPNNCFYNDIFEGLFGDQEAAAAATQGRLIPLW